MINSMTHDKTPHQNPSPHTPPHHRRFSPLTRRILAVNVLAPALLLVGVFYLGEYRRSLIIAELSSLRTNGEIFAVALGESAVSPLGKHLLPEMASQIVRRLAVTADTRARLFASNGALVADSRTLLQPGGKVVEAENLPPPGLPHEKVSFLNRLFTALDALYMWIPGTKEYPPYFESTEQSGKDYREVVGAMQGEVWMARRSMPDGSLVLSVALPVTRYKQTMAVLMLSKTSADIDAAMFQVRKDTLKVFAVILIFTILVSLYLGGTIARPIRILGRAAGLVRGGHHRQHTIPKMTARHDEIGDLAAALNGMTEALWERMDAIEAFAADVSHEIKNPLTSLKSAVETVGRVTDPVKQRKLMAVILDDVERLDRLITDISNASRLDAELSRGETTPVDITRLLSALADIHTHTANEHSPILQANIEDNLTLNGLEDRLVQVFRNLITNAVSFSPPAPAIIRLQAKRRDDWMIITIEDQGPGIPPGKEQDIFNRFYTERPATEEFGRHSGLGLSISQQIVETHGGTITACNILGPKDAIVGACFTVCLPRV